MTKTQPDLFSGGGVTPEHRTQPDSEVPSISPAELDNDTLLAVIMEAGLADSPSLIAEAVRREMPAAVSVLEKLCFRFAGFGTDLLIPEQKAALQALAAIGGQKAALSVVRLIVKAAVQGPTLKVAVNVAAQLGSNLPGDMVRQLLGHADAEVRADACRCARAAPDTIFILIGLLEDLNRGVNVAAACALGRMGNRDALPMLSRMLRDAPSAEIIDAISGVADEDSIILLGRLLQTESALSSVVRDALDAIDHPRAAQITGTMRA